MLIELWSAMLRLIFHLLYKNNSFTVKKSEYESNAGRHSIFITLSIIKHEIKNSGCPSASTPIGS